MVHVKRHIVKTISWRIIGTIDTIILAGLISGNWKIGLSVGGAEVLTKMTLYYLHSMPNHHKLLFQPYPNQ